MSTGSLLGGVAGGVLGFFIGGPVGALWGASIGFGVGMALDPIQPDTPAPGQMGMEVQVTTAKYGDPIPDILGTIKLTGNITWYCCDSTVEETEEVEAGGKGGGGSQTAVTGYKYYLSWAMSICLGPVDTLYTIYKDDEIIWDGELDCPVNGGQRSIYIESLETTIVFFYGTDDQEPLTALCRHLEAGNITGGPANPVGTGTCDNDTNLNTPYRGLCWVYVPNAYIGGYNRAPTLKFVVKKRPTITDGESNDIPYGNIGDYDYNPAHAVWYIQETLAGLPKSFMDSDSFEDVATQLFIEQRGISILFAQRQSALTYIESVNAHADMIERFDIDGSLHLKLIRADEDVDDLPVVNPNMLVEDPVVNRPSWLGATNEVKVVFSERIAEGEDVYEDCDPELEFDDESTPATIDPGGWIYVYLTGVGTGPYTWEVEGTGYSLRYSQTADEINILEAESGDCDVDIEAFCTITATDVRGCTATAKIRSTDGEWVLEGWRAGQSFGSCQGCGEYPPENPCGSSCRSTYGTCYGEKWVPTWLDENDRAWNFECVCRKSTVIDMGDCVIDPVLPACYPSYWTGGGGSPVDPPCGTPHGCGGYSWRCWVSGCSQTLYCEDCQDGCTGGYIQRYWYYTWQCP